MERGLLWMQLYSKIFPVILVSHQDKNTRTIVWFTVFLLFYINLFQNLRVIRGWNLRKENERDRNGFVSIIFFPKSFVTLGVTCVEGRWISKADNCILILLIKQLDNCIRVSQKSSVNAVYILFSPGNFRLSLQLFGFDWKEKSLCFVAMMKRQHGTYFFFPSWQDCFFSKKF